MKKEQTSLLVALAAKLKKEQTSKEAAIASLSSAGIITKKGKMTKSFPNLERVLSVAE
ncbi:hypothetical protein TMP248_100003 [Tenacibaculum maritimum]|uniref:Uncharacterized protein n=1 Tax=Tenacibaculum maritimum NCIMB 2154 TaxID=1349785 RepID=A0A2H1EBD5_9FLAO|nr:hypothetical protein [Tenacibaculum maritimum]CAA0149780.1 hypothetical protein FS0810_10137 [Tenacibaculum maritimum]CAA0156104.1 hypothetical protein TMP248_100003 [Tenacibaculum maritimum]CAA0209478.1 hypothetical protein NACSLCCMFF_320042 [Tenacibaculum maritimum]SFZ83858.1 protein of unknown function [Tenacibaculum maritimum NCIMB 2154]